MLDKEQISKLLKSFYTVTGIKVVVFDPMFNEIMAYPHGHCSFCTDMKAKNGYKCKRSEEEFCNKAKSLMNLYTGRCHAGLVESVIPITDNHLITGYIMFGQIRMVGDKLYEDGMSALYDEVLSKTPAELEACTDILRTLGQYIMSRHHRPSAKAVTGISIAEYIEHNLSEDLSIDTLCKKFRLSRSKLYSLTSPFMPGGIAAHIKLLRLERAKELLSTTDLSVPRVASAVGYGDYNYFCKDFKKKFGISAKQYSTSYKI